MQVQQISNSNNPTFQGRVAIVGDLSAIPAKAVREAAPNLKKLLADKPFDLFIRENYNNDCIDFIVQKPKHFDRKIPDFIYVINKRDKEKLTDSKAYYETAEFAITNHERRLRDNAFSTKVKKFFKKLTDALQNKEEI